MFLLDDVLLFPIHGIMAVFREIHNAAEQEAANEAEAIRTELGDLYMMLETGRLSEDEFDRREKELLDRLDAIEAANSEEETDETEEVPDEETDEEAPEPVIVAEQR